MHLDYSVELGALPDFQACMVNSRLLLLGTPKMVSAAFHKVLSELAPVTLGYVDLAQGV